MPDPNAWPQFPGFPQEGSANAIPTRAPNVTSSGKVNSLFPAISRADQERGVGSLNRSAFGPPAGGWPVGSADLSPLKQRTIAGIQHIAEQEAGQLGAGLQMALGGILGLLSQKLDSVPDAVLLNALNDYAGRMRYWITGQPEEGGELDGGAPHPSGEAEPGA